MARDNDETLANGGETAIELTSLHLRQAVGGCADSLAWLVRRLSPLLIVQAEYRLGPDLRRVYDPEDLVDEVWVVALPRLGELSARDGRYTALRFAEDRLELFDLESDPLERRPMAGCGEPCDALVAQAEAYARMLANSEHGPLELIISPVKFSRYFVWLLGEIAKANWTVAKAIMTPDMPIRQHFFEVPFSQRSDLARTVFANSITLTPGTITVEVEDDAFLVHAVGYKDDDPQALAKMDANVTGTEVP